MKTPGKKEFKMKHILFFLLLNVFITTGIYGQSWVRTFDKSTNSWFLDMVETYDKGYLISGQVDPGNGVPFFYASLIKADINGYSLWSITIASSIYQIGINGMDKTTDGGFILTGVTNKLDSTNNLDILFVKLNSCGEKEWCKIISTPENDDYGLKIKYVDNGYMALIKYFQDWATKRIWLFRLDLKGNILWEKLVNESTTFFDGAEPRWIFVRNDQSYIITGDGYDGSPGHPYKLRPLIIKTDSSGNDLWTLPWGHTCGLRGELARGTAENPSGFFYTAASHFRDSIPYGDSPCFLKTSPDGQEVSYRDLIPDSRYGGAATLDMIDVDSLLISAGWTDHNQTITKTGVIKCDTLGNVTKTKVLLENVINSVEGSLITFDNKYLAAGGMGFNTTPFHSKIYLFKLNMNLEYDSVYTAPRTYDSLCPYPIVSDTMNLDDCGIITDVREPMTNPESSKLQIFPNPAKDKLTIRFPKYLRREAQNGTVQTTTIYHQWKSTTLEVYALNGSRLLSKEIPKGQTDLQLDVTDWQRGMYYFRLTFNGEVITGEKALLK